MPILNPDLLATFRGLLDDARKAGDPEPTAMTLATVDSAGQPSARTVLLKAVDADGFVFYTNTHSRKGGQLSDNPRAALLFFRSEEHTSELQSLMRISYAVFCLKKKKIHNK